MLERKFAENLEKLAKFEGYYDDAKPVKIWTIIIKMNTVNEI